MKEKVILWSPEPPEGDGDCEPEFNYHKIKNIEFDDIDYKDYPDFCDAFISYAEFDGRPLTEEELEEVNADRDFIHEKLIEYIF